MNDLNVTDEMLTAYIDGEADPSHIEAIENYIASSNEARIKVEALRKTNAILNTIAEEIVSKPLPENIQVLIRNKKRKEQKSKASETSLFKKLQIIIESISAPLPQVAMVAASLVLGVYIGVNNIQTNDFNLEPGSYDLMVTRGSSSLNELIPILEIILEEKKQTSTISQGDQQYTVNLLDKFELSNADQCLIGEIKNLVKDTSDVFIGCLTNDNSWNINFTSHK